MVQNPRTSGYSLEKDYCVKQWPYYLQALESLEASVPALSSVVEGSPQLSRTNWTLLLCNCHRHSSRLQMSHELVMAMTDQLVFE